jgi:hypothetical protein
MDSTAEPIDVETLPSGTTKQDNGVEESSIEADSQPDDDDSILDELLGSVESDDDEADVDSSAPATDSKPSTSAFDRDTVAKILKRDGVPDEIISSASDAVLAEWAAKAEKRQKDVDSYGGRVKQMEEQLAQAKSPQDADAQANKSASTPPVAIDPFAQMSDMYGEDVVAPVRSAFQMQQQQMQERMLLAEARASDASIRVQYGAKAPSFDVVVAKMSAMGAAKPGGYASIDELTRAAYTELVGTTKSAPSVKNSQPTAPRASSPPVKPPARDADDDVLDQIFSGTHNRSSRIKR